LWAKRRRLRCLKKLSVMQTRADEIALNDTQNRMLVVGTAIFEGTLRQGRSLKHHPRTNAKSPPNPSQLEGLLLRV
jgi:hypothetical protein